MTTDNKIPWYKRKEIWGAALTVLSFSPEIINSFVGVGVLQEYTLIAKLATPVGLILSVLGLRKGYQADNLPSGLSNMLDKVPDKLTGERGSANAFK